jgi:6-phosphofructokinase 1
MAILVGGGPAPGINSVISAATIRAALEGIEVLGIRDGFEWIMHGDVEHVKPLTIEEVSRIHFRGGSHIGISRANPTLDEQHLENTVISLLRLNVTMLITIGGDDTAYSAMRLEQKAGGRIHVVHVPKTIDNDLDLPPHVDTFGFQTARHIGVDIVKNLMVGRQDHVALVLRDRDGPQGRPPRARHRQGRRRDPDADPRGVADAEGEAAGVRRHAGRRDHQAPELRPPRRRRDPGRGAGALDRPRGPREAGGGRARLARPRAHRRGQHRRDPEVAGAAAAQKFGIKTTVVAKNIGYELRCADPIPMDMEYTRDLGYCAAKDLLAGGNAVMISMQAGHFVPVPFKDMLDP